VVYSASVSSASAVGSHGAPHIVIVSERCANVMLPAAALPEPWSEYVVEVPSGMIVLGTGQGTHWGGADVRVTTSGPETTPMASNLYPTNGSASTAVLPGNASLSFMSNVPLRLPGAGVARWPAIALVQAGAVEVQGTGFASDSLDVQEEFGTV